MKIVFVGPTLPELHGCSSDDGIGIRPPAVQGDIFRAVGDGATVIGLIDGNFEYVAPVWHKEILHGLSLGVTIAGAASMGALRAAECQAFGMIGVGEIFRQYAAGEIEDDAEVGQLHAPAELGYAALSEPLVNVRATLHKLSGEGRLSPEEALLLLTAAAGIFFKHCTWKTILAAAADLTPERRVAITALLADHAVNQKRLDAEALMAFLRQHPAKRGAAPAGWTFNETFAWRAAMSEMP